MLPRGSIIGEFLGAIRNSVSEFQTAFIYRLGNAAKLDIVKENSTGIMRIAH
jgi:hypothetical protein